MKKLTKFILIPKITCHLGGKSEIVETEIFLCVILLLPFNLMASDGVHSTFADLPASPILHYWGIEIVTPAKRFSVSSFLQQHSKMDVLEFLHATFPDKRQIILVPSGNGNNSSLDSYSFETLEEIVHFKPQVESVPIIHDGNRQGYESLRGDFLGASDNEKPSFLNLIKDFVHHELFENISNDRRVRRHLVLAPHGRMNRAPFGFSYPVPRYETVRRHESQALISPAQDFLGVVRAGRVVKR